MATSVDEDPVEKHPEELITEETAYNIDPLSSTGAPYDGTKSATFADASEEYDPAEIYKDDTAEYIHKSNVEDGHDGIRSDRSERILRRAGVTAEEAPYDISYHPGRVTIVRFDNAKSGVALKCCRESTGRTPFSVYLRWLPLTMSLISWSTPSVQWVYFMRRARSCRSLVCGRARSCLTLALCMKMICTTVSMKFWSW